MGKHVLTWYLFFVLSLTCWIASASHHIIERYSERVGVFCLSFPKKKDLVLLCQWKHVVHFALTVLRAVLCCAVLCFALLCFAVVWCRVWLPCCAHPASLVV